MCGIIGIIGKADAAPLLLDGLKRLEYRGYDSAGIATLVDGAIERRRAEGKISNLNALIEAQPLLHRRQRGLRAGDRGAAAARHHRHRSYALGHPRPADRNERPSACRRAGRAGP